MQRPRRVVATAPVSARALHDVAQLSRRERNFRPVAFEDAAGDPQWRVDRRRSVLPAEPPGAPRADGAFDVAREIMTRYQFADPSVIRAVYDPTTDLDGRDILMVGRFFGLRFHMGVRVSGVIEQETELEGRSAHQFRWQYHTLQGHLEQGQMDHELLKWVDTGAVEFRVRAYSRRADIGNPIVRLGFILFGRAVQSRFYDRSLARMQALVVDEVARRRHVPDPATTVTAPDEDHVATRYSFAFDPRFVGLLRLLGVRPDRAYVEITDQHFEARFGPWRVVTPLVNIKGTSITGPHRPLRAIGARFSPSTHSLTFGSNVQRTVRIAFRRPVPGMEPFGIVRHPSLSISVADPERMRDHLEALAVED